MSEGICASCERSFKLNLQKWSCYFTESPETIMKFLTSAAEGRVDVYRWIITFETSENRIMHSKNIRQWDGLVSVIFTFCLPCGSISVWEWCCCSLCSRRWFHIRNPSGINSIHKRSLIFPKKKIPSFESSIRMVTSIHTILSDAFAMLICTCSDPLLLAKDPSILVTFTTRFLPHKELHFLSCQLVKKDARLL